METLRDNAATRLSIEIQGNIDVEKLIESLE